MRFWASSPQATPNAQLPDGSSVIQTMENYLSFLKSAIATWLSSGFAPWVTYTILILLSGLGLFLLLLPFLGNKLSLSPPRKQRNIKKVRNLCPRPNRDFLFSYLYFPFSKSPRETPEMRILGNNRTSSS